MPRTGPLSTIKTLLQLTRAGIAIGALVAGAFAYGQQNSSSAVSQVKSKDRVQPWSLQASAQYNKPVKDESLEILEFALGLGYKTSALQSFILSSSYAKEISKYENESSSSLESLDLSWVRTNSSISYGLQALAPVSQSDTAAGFRGGLAAFIGAQYKAGFHIFSSRLEATGYSYAFDTADIRGTTYNKKHSQLAVLAWTYELSDRWSWQNSGNFYAYTNTLENGYQYYGFSSDLELQVSARLSARAGVSTNDRVVTERKILDDDNTRYRISLEWNL